MNDYQAMDAICEVLEQHYRGNLSPELAILDIAQIAGANKPDHQEAGPQ